MTWLISLLPPGIAPYLVTSKTRTPLALDARRKKKKKMTASNWKEAIFIGFCRLDEILSYEYISVFGGS